MSTLERMANTIAVCDDCGDERRVRIWPDDELRAIGNDGRCDCGSLSFHRRE
ncbi:hypothetical protein [Halovivax gelatinilyticus]|uniref:hypothetical protein n=1 Tax=Halovivax gelatinilyticus TaxID=2961597 RepID=UPI0020CA2C7D|nr:hypothetical protein [Halovivax gelatinilyticus]